MRDVKFDRQLGRLATLTTTGAVQLWDPHLSPIRTVRGFPNTSNTFATYFGVLNELCKLQSQLADFQSCADLGIRPALPCQP